jgi:dolichyl-phosphate-mannose--protein O-mannosyl transferase
MWYYSYDNYDGTRSTIACMGNPAIWWFSVFTFIATFMYSVKKKQKEGIILIIMILSTLLPYARISREMYIYHYFIVLPYMMATIVYAVKLNIDFDKKYYKFIPILSALFLIVFLIFYPIYSGLAVPEKYIEFTQWLPMWNY